MPRQNSKPTDIWAGFTAALLNQSENRPIGAGWKTFDEILSDGPFGKSKLYLAVRKSVSENKLEVFTGSVIKNNKLVRQVWYRPTGK